ncbi:MAG: pyruvate carboxyltransferase [Clostridiales bacterium]|nr:pyruvate carboxyltransferase [Clostridiales bacterium]
MEYVQLRGEDRGMNLPVLTELAEYFEKELDYNVPPMTPFVGKSFNLTKAGIHADGILKDEEIYNIFDTKKILNRPVVIAIDAHSGLAGIAAWINFRYGLMGKDKVDKKDNRVVMIKEWIDKEYKKERVTSISDREMEEQVSLYFHEITNLALSEE